MDPATGPRTFEIMESWLSKDAAWLSLSQASKALNVRDKHAIDQRQAAARDDAAREWAAIHTMRLEKLHASYWPKGAC